MVTAVRLAEVRSKGQCGRLWVGGRPGKKDLCADMAELREMGVNVVVCCMQWEEMARLGIAEYPAAAQRSGLMFYHYPLKDCTAPDPRRLAELVPRVCDHLLAGDSVFVHCKAGLGRSASLCAACLLHFGYQPEAAIKEVRRLRPGAIALRSQTRSILDYHQKYVSA